MFKIPIFRDLRQILSCSLLFFLDVTLAMASKKCLDQNKICQHISSNRNIKHTVNILKINIKFKISYE